MQLKQLWILSTVAVFLVVLCFVLAWFFLLPGKHPTPITALIKEVSGEVKFARGTEWIAARNGLRLQPKAQVYTAGDGRLRLDYQMAPSRASDPILCLSLKG